MTIYNLIGEHEQKLGYLNNKLAANEQINQNLANETEQFRANNTELQAIVEALNKEIDNFKTNQVFKLLY